MLLQLNTKQMFALEKVFSFLYGSDYLQKLIHQTIHDDDFSFICHTVIMLEIQKILLHITENLRKKDSIIIFSDPMMECIKPVCSLIVSNAGARTAFYNYVNQNYLLQGEDANVDEVLIDIIKFFDK
jgi:hypothetical protein